MTRARIILGLAVVSSLGCRGATGKVVASPARGAATCSVVTSQLAIFGETLEATSADAKTRVITYAGLLELLISLEGAAVELDAELGAQRGMSSEVEAKMKTARGALGRSAQFAHGERDAVEKHAREISPLAKETQQAWTALRSACDGKRAPPDCAPVRDAVARFDAAETNGEHERVVAELRGLRLSPTIGKSRDRAVAASKAVQTAIKARAESSQPIPRRWASVQKDLAGALNGLAEACRGDTPPSAQLIVSARPDPRKLTVLVHMKPPAGVERSLLSLAKASTDEDERAFYEGRAEGAFGSGFFLVRKNDKGSDEVLVVTNRHVVELGDRATLELADGSSLGAADVVYSNPSHDLAVLRPTTKLALNGGFALAELPAKDQQTVIATGFPGLVGRPSYQTTKGYVSNESFHLDDGSRPLIYVQHTAPIDPGSSGGPLTDDAGRVLGVNTLKVTGREGVGLAVPARYVLETLRTARAIESRHASGPSRQKAARLACLGFLAELGAAEPRMLVLEQMISNHLVGTDGLDAAAALSKEEGFEHLWNTDSVRAMRIATLVRVRSAFLRGGGPSVLETCDDEAGSVGPEQAKYRIRLGNFETRELALRWEHGRWKVDSFDAPKGLTGNGSKRLPPPGPPASSPNGGKRVAPPKPR